MLRAFLTVLAVCVTAKPTATRLIRFLDKQGNEHYGQYIGDNMAQLIEGNLFGKRELRAEKVEIHRLLSPVPQPPAIVGIGLNYWGHINASHLEPPKTPSVFAKNKYTYNHPFSAVVVPSTSREPDYEGELGVIISKQMKDISEDEALDYVLGYTVCNDVSARCFQNEKNGCLGNGGQWTMSKSLDTHCPLGPAIITPDGLTHPDGTGLWLETRVNGDLRQNQTTTEMVFGIKKILSFISTGTTYDAGTVICTGTPDGVGDTMNPQVFLQDGDKMDVRISEIGVLTNTVKRDSAAESLAETPSLDEYLYKDMYTVVGY